MTRKSSASTPKAPPGGADATGATGTLPTDDAPPLIRNAGRVVALIVGVLLLVGAYGLWRDPPSPQISTETSKTTTGQGDMQTVSESPAVAEPGRDKDVVLVFLIAGTILMFAAALPNRDLSITGPGGLGAALTSAGAGAAKLAKEKAKDEGLGDQAAEGAAALAAQQAAAILPAKLQAAQPSTLERAVKQLPFTGDLPDPSEVLSKAATETVKQAATAGVAQARALDGN